VKASYPARLALSRRSAITLECYSADDLGKRFTRLCPSRPHLPGKRRPGEGVSDGRHARFGQVDTRVDRQSPASYIPPASRPQPSG